MAFCLPKSLFQVKGPCSPRDPALLVLLCLFVAAFATPVKLSLSELTILLTLTFLIFCALPSGAAELVVLTLPIVRCEGWVRTYVSLP